MLGRGRANGCRAGSAGLGCAREATSCDNPLGDDLGETTGNVGDGEPARHRRGHRDRSPRARDFAVCVNDDKDDGQAERIVETIREHGGRAILAPGSVAVEADVVRVFATIDRELGPVTALVNNAAVVGKPGRVEDQTGEALRALFAVNILGYILCAREAIRRMSTEHGGEGGSIVNVSSAGARDGGAGILVPYCATTGAVDTLTIGLAGEVGPQGIRVNAVRPGTIDTPIQADVGFPDLAAVEGPKAPLRRAGTPQDVAEVIVWLCSDRAAYVSRAIVDVTGGE